MVCPSLVVVFLFLITFSNSQWHPLMPGGLKLGIDGKIYSFTSDLCSGGIFFKNPVKLDLMCTHGYFIRRPDGCMHNGSDIIAGQYYVCTKYDNQSDQKSPTVQAFFPVTEPELPLEHTITFYDDENTLRNFRRFNFLRGLQRRYVGRETGAVWAVVSNTHNTPDTSIGSLCYQGWPDTDGGAFWTPFPSPLPGGGGDALFTRKCRVGGIRFPFRRSTYFKRTMGFSSPEDFQGEHVAKLPGFFPEDGDDEDNNPSENEIIAPVDETEGGNGLAPSTVLIDLPEEGGKELAPTDNTGTIGAGSGLPPETVVIDLPEEGGKEPAPTDNTGAIGAGSGLPPESVVIDLPKEGGKELAPTDNTGTIGAGSGLPPETVVIDLPEEGGKEPAPTDKTGTIGSGSGLPPETVVIDLPEEGGKDSGAINNAIDNAGNAGSGSTSDGGVVLDFHPVGGKESPPINNQVDKTGTAASGSTPEGVVLDFHPVGGKESVPIQNVGSGSASDVVLDIPGKGDAGSSNQGTSNSGSSDGVMLDIPNVDSHQTLDENRGIELDIPDRISQSGKVDIGTILDIPDSAPAIEFPTDVGLPKESGTVYIDVPESSAEAEPGSTAGGKPPIGAGEVPGNQNVSGGGSESGKNPSEKDTPNLGGKPAGVQETQGPPKEGEIVTSAMTEKPSDSSDSTSELFPASAGQATTETEFAAEYSTELNEIFRHGPMKLKLEPILSQELTNWDPYIEEAVIMAKYIILRDMEHTKGYDFEEGKVIEGPAKLGLTEQAQTKWFEIIKAAGDVVKASVPEDMLPPKFIDDSIQLFGYMFRNLEDEEMLDDGMLQTITGSLQKCAGSSQKVVANGIGCPLKFREVVVGQPDGMNITSNLEKLPPAANSFRSHKEDVVVATVWDLIDFVISACYPAFTPDNVNEHHRLYVFMKETFRHERIQKRWFTAFKGTDAYAGLLPYGNYKTLLYNLDKFRAAVRANSIYSDWIPKPELLVPDYSGVNIFKVSHKYQHKHSHASRDHLGVAVRQMIGDNEDPFIVGHESVKHIRPFKAKVNKRLGVRWRVKRQAVEDNSDEFEPKPFQIPRPPKPPFDRPDLKKYEIWGGLAYCLQANYELVGDKQLKMSGFTPSVEDLKPLCNSS